MCRQECPEMQVGSSGQFLVVWGPKIWKEKGDLAPQGKFLVVCVQKSARRKKFRLHVVDVWLVGTKSQQERR